MYFINLVVFCKDFLRGAPTLLAQIPSASKARARRKGGVGGNSAAPELEAKPRRPARKVEGRTERKNCLFLLEEFFGGARKSEIVKAIFLLRLLVSNYKTDSHKGCHQVHIDFVFMDTSFFCESAYKIALRFVKRSYVLLASPRLVHVYV